MVGFAAHKSRHAAEGRWQVRAFRPLMGGVVILLISFVWLSRGQTGAPVYPPNPVPAQRPSQLIQRTLRLLAESLPERRNRVHILFYGQSITEAGWVREVERSLRQRYPHADLVLENRALGGFPTQLLAKTAETDVYDFYPDLLVFHAYGAHDKYEDILRRVRERTTSEIMIQTDHVTQPSDITEEMDRARVSIAASPWTTFMNQLWLPSLAARYGTALCDPRAVWKGYLQHHRLAPQALLLDEIHPNPHGDWLLAESIKACLRRDPRLGRSAAEERVKTLKVGDDVRFEHGTLRVPFTGNRIDVVFREAAGTPRADFESQGYEVRIDGKRPSEWAELYGLTRAVSPAGGKWPLVVDIGAQAPRGAERWTLAVTTLSREPERYAFRLVGSSTGFDGEGDSSAHFVSRSGKVVIPKESWVVRYALELAGREVPDSFEVAWHVVPRGIDHFGLEVAGRRGSESSLTLAQGLPNGPHWLELHGASEGIAALRVYRPDSVPDP